nr:hypothetical protein [Tanacetum cinerariifolium]
MAVNGLVVGKPKEWAHPCYRLSTWKEVYSHKVQRMNGCNSVVKSSCPTTILQPNYRVPIGRPKKKRARSLCEKDELVKNGKLSKKGRTRQSSGSQIVVSQADMVGSQAFGSQVDMVGSKAFGSQTNGIRTQISVAGNGNMVNSVQGGATTQAHTKVGTCSEWEMSKD